MSRFSEWFDDLVAEAERSEDGTLFKAAGCELDHTGGRCTAWRRSAAGEYYILITDSTGTDHRLGDSYVIDAGGPDRWLVGLHLEGDHLDSFEAATVAEAIEAAERLVVAARQFSATGE